MTLNSIPKARDAAMLTLSVSSLAHHAGEEGAETRVGVQGRELQRAPEVLDVTLAGLHGPLDVVEGVAELAAAGLDAGEGGESRGVPRVGGYGPLQDFFRNLEVVGDVVEARVRVEGAGVGGVGLERLHEMFLSPLHLSPALVEDAELQVGLGVLGIERDHGLVSLSRSFFVSEGEPPLPEGYEMPDFIPTQRHRFLGEPE